MNLAEIRQNYPQYGDLSDEDLATRLHSRYYPDLSFDDFSNRIGYQPTEQIPVGETPEAQMLAQAVEPEGPSLLEPVEATGRQIVEETGELLGPVARGEFDAPTALVETVGGLATGFVAFADEMLTRVSNTIEQLAIAGQVDFREVNKAAKMRESLYHFEPSDPLARATLAFISAIPQGIETAANVLADQFEDHNVKAAIQTVGYFGSLAAFGQVFRTLQAPLKPKPTVKIPKTAKEFEKFMTEERAKQLEQEFAEIKPKPREELPTKLIEELREVEPLKVEAYEVPPELRVEKPYRAIKAKEPGEVLYKRKGRITKEKPEEVLRAKLEEKPKKVKAKVEEKPTASFLGWQETPKGDHVALYNIESGTKKGTTVMVEGLKREGIEIPKTPEKPAKVPPAKPILEKAPAKPIPEAKEPWEMTKNEWLRSKAIDKEQLKRLKADKIVGATMIKAQHEVAVRDAIFEGKIKSHPDYPEFGKVKGKETIKDIMDLWDKRGIKNWMSEKNKTITLSQIELPKAERAKGLGSKAMQELIEYADRTGQRIVLTPSKDYGATSVKRLETFYKRFDFTMNVGRKKDYRFRETMIRRPKAKEVTPVEPKAKAGFVWEPKTGRVRPFKEYKEITKGKNKGKIQVFLADKKIIVDKKAIKTYPEEPKAVTLDTLGFQQMYERFTKRVKKTKPTMPKTDLKIFDTGQVIKQRKSKARGLEFPPIYEGELKVLKTASEKDMPRGALFKHGFQNPPRIFDQYFGEDFKSMTYWQIAEAKHRADVGYKSFKNRVNELKASVPLKSRKRIKIYEIAQQEGGLKRLENQGIKDVPKLTAKEMAVYKEGEGIYETLYYALNKARKMAGKEPFGKVKNYGPFIHDLGLLEQMGFNPGLERFDIINQYIQMRATPFRYAKPRAEFFAKKLELDYFSTMDQYGHSAINHIQMSPVISKLHEFTLTFGKKGEAWRMNEAVPRKAQWYRAWLDHVAGKPSMLDQTVGPFVTRTLNKLNQNATFAILGGNLRTVLIQPSALMHTYVELGPKYTLKGILSLVDPKQRNMAFEKSTHLLSREYDVAARDAYAAIKKGTFREWAGKKAMKGVQLTDMEAALATWQGAYLRGKKELNYTERKAARYADDVTIRTQASAARGDISPIQRSKIGRVATLFQTFVINEWNFMVNDVIGYRTPSIKGYERFKRIRRFVVGATLVNMFYEDILGLHSPYPSPIGAFRKAIEEGKELPSMALDIFKELIEKVPIISGARYGAVGPAWLSKAVKSMYTGKRIAETVGTLAGVPATSQIGKMLRAQKRGETPLGVLIGRYTPEQVLRERLRKRTTTID